MSPRPPRAGRRDKSSPPVEGSPSAAGPARRGRSPVQKLLISLGILGVVGCLVPAAVVGWGIRQYSNIDRVRVDIDERESAADPINFLVVGSDSRDGINDETELSEGFLDGEAQAAGQRSDTLMVVRLDPNGPSVDLLSFPRDLYVPVEPSGTEAKLNSAYNNGPQAVIDTIQKNYLIPIHHYMEVDFNGFQLLVDSIDGVPMYFEREMADTSTGLHIRKPGCVTLSGSQALAFARSRKLQYMQSDQWKIDQAGDLGRIARQQYLLQKSVTRASRQKPDSPADVLSLLRFVTENVTIDDSLGIDDMAELVEVFGNIDGESLVTHSLPVRNDRTGTGSAIVRLIEDEAIDELAVFTGQPVESAVQEKLVVQVFNATGRRGLAAQVTDAYSAIGFRTIEPGNGEINKDITVVRHAPGQRSAADLVGKHLGAGARLVTDPELTGWNVQIDVGANFTVVTEEAGERVIVPRPPPSASSVTQPPRQAAVDGAGEDAAPVQANSPSSRPPRISPSGFGVIPFEAPANQPCG